MLPQNLNKAFPNAKVNARNTLPKRITKPNFVIVNVHHRITEDDVKEIKLQRNECHQSVNNNKSGSWLTNKINTCDNGIEQSSQRSTKTASK